MDKTDEATLNLVRMLVAEKHYKVAIEVIAVNTQTSIIAIQRKHLARKAERHLVRIDKVADKAVTLLTNKK